MNSPLLTDLYQLTMAYGYWKAGRQQAEGVFYLFFRRAPFGGNHALAVGLEQVVEYLQSWAWGERELGWLASLHDPGGQRLFPDAFLQYLSTLRFDGYLDAVPEGTALLPGTPMLRIRGSLIMGQLLETALLTFMNYPSLVATKAARVVHAANGDPVLEFGLRRAPGPDGALSASRAAFIGGCAATSHVLAGQRFGIPMRGTHAHSWVMSFQEEMEAFLAYAAAFPGSTVLLVDTYDTLTGVDHAIEVAAAMREQGDELAGIRLDSGDLLSLSIEARKRLNEAGFPDVRIVASDDLDETRIAALKAGGARIDVWGVGTKLVNAEGETALTGVYKLAAHREHPEQPWQLCAKLSDDPAKGSWPGLLQVARKVEEGKWAGDTLFDEWQRQPKPEGSPLLVPVIAGGKLVMQLPSLVQVRAYAQAQQAAMTIEWMPRQLAVSEEVQRNWEELRKFRRQN